MKKRTMRKQFHSLLLCLFYLSGTIYSTEVKAKEAYLFAYFTDQNSNKNGLHFAWSEDGYQWKSIGPEHSFLRCDYGRWDTEKRMRDPFIMKGADGLWHCIWTLNWEANAIGHSASKDLIHWSRQSYPKVMNGYQVRNIWAPEMIYDDEKQQYILFWASTIQVNGVWKTEEGKRYDNRMYYTTTKDFKTYTPAKLFFDPEHNVIDATIRKFKNQYYLIYKDETELPTPQKNLLVAVSNHAEGPYQRISSQPFTKDWVEGPAINQLPDSSFLVYMDAYREHRYEAMQTKDFQTWEDVTEKLFIPEGAKHGSVITVSREQIDSLINWQRNWEERERKFQGKEGVEAPKPLFKDPACNGATAPMVIWNPQIKKWWMFYTNHQANQTHPQEIKALQPMSIGIAESADGANWNHQGAINMEKLPADFRGEAISLWTPHIVLGEDGKWHMYLGVSPDNNNEIEPSTFIAHFTSSDLLHWNFEQRLSQMETGVLDFTVLKTTDGGWRMYYKKQEKESPTMMSQSKDLYEWDTPQPALKGIGKALNSFYWKGYQWIIMDGCKEQQVYRSKEGNEWEAQPIPLLLTEDEGSGTDCITPSTNGKVLISNDRAYMYYFMESKRISEERKKDNDKQCQSSIQVVELEMNGDKWITANPNKPTYVQLLPPMTIEAAITIHTQEAKPISNLLMGIFFEDLNYAADGGLYAELVQNRDFEYTPQDLFNSNQAWNSLKSWELITEQTAEATLSIDTIAPIHPNNKHFAAIDVKHPGKGVALINEGFDGIALKAGEGYLFSLFARNQSGKKEALTVRLIGKNGEVYAEGHTKKLTNAWEKYTLRLVVHADVPEARLEIRFNSKANVALDMISLFPEKTFKNRPNGLRADLAQAIADLHPRFVRFPGGCVAHGNGLSNMYRWMNTVGSLEARKPQGNLWGYHQTAGLGYFEYFQFCEDLGAEPVPVVPAAVCCQNSNDGGQQGLPMCEMKEYVQEVLDLIEYANGDATTKWGKVRAEAGHPAPFNLKYLGVGNEDLISDIFEERFTLIFNAVREKHPEITVIGTSGPNFEGTDYEEGWKIANKLGVPMIDEHYYQTPGWFIHNQHYYDQYDRSKAKVYLGEYASHIPGRITNMETALTEALHLNALERNGDVVSMASYAPLLAKEKHTHWNPDLIYFTNTEVKPTTGYYVQQLYGQNAGESYLASTITLSNPQDAVAKRISVSTVKEQASGDLIIKLVNILPTAVNAAIRLDGVKKIHSKAKITVLKGEKREQNSLPETSERTVSEAFNHELPASSLTVIRIKTGE